MRVHACGWPAGSVARMALPQETAGGNHALDCGIIAERAAARRHPAATRGIEQREGG